MTTQQQKIYAAIGAFNAEHGYAPSVRDLCDAVGLRSKATMAWHLGRLHARGYIKWDRNKSRSIVIVDRPTEQSA